MMAWHHHFGPLVRQNITMGSKTGERERERERDGEVFKGTLPRAYK
jgi:hypothetical protein